MEHLTQAACIDGIREKETKVMLRENALQIEDKLEAKHTGAVTGIAVSGVFVKIGTGGALRIKVKLVLCICRQQCVYFKFSARQKMRQSFTMLINFWGTVSAVARGQTFNKHLTYVTGLAETGAELMGLIVAGGPVTG